MGPCISRPEKDPCRKTHGSRHQSEDAHAQINKAGSLNSQARFPDQLLQQAPSSQMRLLSAVQSQLLDSANLQEAAKDALVRIAVEGMLQEHTHPEEALADLKLTHLLGSGGFAPVFAGLWQGTTPVAVKLCAPPTREGVDPSAVTEALLSRGLSHPYIVRTHAARCTVLTPDFLSRVYPQQSSGSVARGDPRQAGEQDAVSASVFATPHPQCAFRADQGNTAGSTTQDGQKDVDRLQPQPESEMDAWPGESNQACLAAILESKSDLHLDEPQPEAAPPKAWLTPLHGGGTSTGAGGSLMGAGHSTHDQPSVDGFNLLSPFTKWSTRRALTWSEILAKLRLRGPDEAVGRTLVIIIMDHTEIGDLLGACKAGIFRLSDNGQASPPPVAPAQRSLLSRPTRVRALIKTAREISLALSHMHAQKVVHGDIKPANILMKESRADQRGFAAAVGDFGLAKLMTAGAGGSDSEEAAAGTLAFLAPEVLHGGPGQASPAADVYALGITMYEMASGQRAYAGMTTAAMKLAVMFDGTRPPWPQPQGGAEEGLRDLYLRCVHAQALRRPSAVQLVDAFTKLDAAAKAEANAAKAGSMERQNAERSD